MAPRTLPRSQRKTNDLLIYFSDQERDALDQLLEELGVNRQVYFRTLVRAHRSGELPVNPALFER